MPPNPDSLIARPGFSNARRGLVVGAFALVVLGGIAVAFGLFHSGRAQQGVLLDGTRLLLIGSEYGLQFHAPQRGVGRVMAVLPRSWQRAVHWTPGKVMLGPIPRTNLCFWLEAAGTRSDGLGLQYLLVDERGFEAPMLFDGPYGIRTLGSFGSPRLASICATRVFPHRGDTVRLRVVQPKPDGGRYDVAEFVVPNPAKGDASKWTASPLPIEASASSKHFVLKQARVGIPDPKHWQDPTGDWMGRWAEFRFQVKEGGRASWGWEIRSIELIDATGNEVVLTGKDRGAFNGRLSFAEGEDVVVIHRWMLWSDETAWRIRVHFQNDAGGNESVEYTFLPEFLPPSK